MIEPERSVVGIHHHNNNYWCRHKITIVMTQCACLENVLAKKTTLSEAIGNIKVEILV